MWGAIIDIVIDALTGNISYIKYINFIKKIIYLIVWFFKKIHIFLIIYINLYNFIK